MSKRKKRKKYQHKRELFQQIRDDLQVSGDIPTTPEGGLRPEVVLASAQSNDVRALPELVAQAARKGWATPDESKVRHVDALSGIIDNPEQPAKVKVAAFNALRQADQAQYERDHPKETKDTTVNVGVKVSVFDRAAEYEEQLRQRLVAKARGALPGDGDRQQVDTTQTDGETG